MVLNLASQVSAAENIYAQKGKSFKISLESNPTTGYSWQVKFDHKYLKLSKRDFKCSSHLVGAGGKDNFEFLALRSGVAKIEFKYMRSWEKGIAPLENKIYTVKIK